MGYLTQFALGMDVGNWDHRQSGPVKARDNPSCPISANYTLLRVTQIEIFSLSGSFLFLTFLCELPLKFMSFGSDQMAEIWSLCLHPMGHLCKSISHQPQLCSPVLQKDLSSWCLMKLLLTGMNKPWQ